VLDFGLAETDVHLVGGQVPVEQLGHGRHVVVVHGAEAVNVRFVLELVLLLELGEGLAFRLITEADINQLFGVEVAMVVHGGGYGGGQGLTCGVDSLPDVVAVHATGDFANQDGGDPVGAELFVRAEEVDLGHQDGFSKDGHVHGDARDAGVQVTLGRVAHADDPLREVAGRVEGPLEEGDGVVEAELAVAVLDVVALEQFVELEGLLVLA